MPSVSLHLVFVTQMADKDEIICRLHSFQRVISSLCFIIAPSPPPNFVLIANPSHFYLDLSQAWTELLSEVKA